jgi:hypothetical protein
MRDDLDILLATPLEEPADNGFSFHVMDAVADIRMRRARLEAVLSLIVVALVALIGVMTPAGAALAQVAQVLVGTPAVWLSLFMLVLSGAVYARVRE